MTTDETKKLAMYSLRLIDFIFGYDHAYSRYEYLRDTSSNKIRMFLNPESTEGTPKYTNMIPYEVRYEIGKYFLTKAVSDMFSGSIFRYFQDYITYDNSYTKYIHVDGYECIEKLKSFYVDEVTSNTVFEYEYKTENFYPIFEEYLYKEWDKWINKKVDKGENPQEIAEMLFENQLNGVWLYHNDIGQNFLKVYLNYLKERNIKISIFTIFKNKVKKREKEITKGNLYFSEKPLFEILAIIVDFYSALLDLYGDSNQKILDKMQGTLNYIFKDILSVERLGFMNTFLYTIGFSNPNYKNDKIVTYFWDKMYTKDMNPILRKMFVNSVIYTWNKSPIPKVRNSVSLLVKIESGKYNDGSGVLRNGFWKSNQKLFYSDIIVNADKIKKSVRTILFSKLIIDEGRL